MPFCPNCRAEYRSEISVCATCPGGVALIDQLPDLVALDPDDPTLVPVGVRALPYPDAREVKEDLIDSGIACLVHEVEGVEFPDRVPRFEVRVRPVDKDRAEAALDRRWRSLAEKEGADVSSGLDFEGCPACGAKVPLDVEECPECGLVVGVGAGEEPDEAQG
jgi:hypothetical protein